MKSRIAVVLAVLAVASCSQSAKPAAPATPGSASPITPGPATPSPATSGANPSSARPAPQLSRPEARRVFAGFLAAFKRVEQTRSSADARRLMTGPEWLAQGLEPGTAFTGPDLTGLVNERFYVPRLESYPRWFIATGDERVSGGAAGFAFLLVQLIPGRPWLDASELYSSDQPLPDLADVKTDAQGYATAVPLADMSLAVAPGALSGGFSRFYDAETSTGTAPAGYTSNVLSTQLKAQRAAPRYGWRIVDELRPLNSAVYSLRLADGGAAVIYLTSETFSWQASSAGATLSAPQSAIDIGAVPPPGMTGKLHITSVKPGLRITLTVNDEHLAIDPPGSGTVTDYFVGKTMAWTAS